MSVIILLVIVGIVVAGLFLIGFIWAVRSGQYDDMYSPSVRILFDNNKSSQESEAEASFKDNDISKENNQNKSNQ